VDQGDVELEGDEAEDTEDVDGGHRIVYRRQGGKRGRETLDDIPEEIPVFRSMMSTENLEIFDTLTKTRQTNRATLANLEFSEMQTAEKKRRDSELVAQQKFLD